MREILNPWVDLAVYNCFGCNPKNIIGARMRFFEDDETCLTSDIISVWKPTQYHQSWINTLHGGMQATLLDEVCGWVVFKKLQTSGVTAKMDIRYKQAVPTNQGVLVLRARLKENNHRIAIVEGVIQDKQGKILTQCECTYFTFNQEKANEMGFRKSQLKEEEVSLEQIIAEKENEPVIYRSL